MSQIAPKGGPDGLQRGIRTLLQDAASTPLILCFPGVEALDPAWWHGCPGTAVMRLRDGDLTATTGPGPLAALRNAHARVGQRLIAVAQLDEVSAWLSDAQNADHGPALAPIGLITCHPWLSFLRARQDEIWLEPFAQKLLRAMSPVRELWTMPWPGAIAPRDLLDQIEQRRVLPPEPGQHTGIDYTGGAPAYEAVCSALGLDPMQVPQQPRAEPPSIGPSELAGTSPQKATVSWFIARLTKLEGSAALTCKMRQLIAPLDACLAEADFVKSLHHAAGMLRPADAATLRMLAGAHFCHQGEPLFAMSQIAESLELLSEDSHFLRLSAALLYLELNRPIEALNALSNELHQRGVLSKLTSERLDQAIYHGKPKDAQAHGQALLIRELTRFPPAATGRKLTMIEVGTTRETVPGQGSTRELALLCDDLGIDFITVDMDPVNTQRAQRMFRRLNLPFRAVTAKGEEYLTDYPGIVDFVFLDAYDFDHGKHSDLRQLRYEENLGGKINDADCHQMHLTCAQALRDKLSPQGLICFDDTWRDEQGAWTAKGATAMPYLLENGFELVEAANNAALLRRQPAEG